MTQPKISIVIPVFNAEKHLKECLDSVVNQSFKDIEIICVNDGSTDNSLNILEEYAVKDDRIKIISTENKGPSHARNTGVDSARGEYIQFLDSDDWIDENLCRSVLANAEKNNSDIVMFNGCHFDAKKKIYLNQSFFTTESWTDHVDENTKHTFLDYNAPILSGNMAVWNKLYKKKFLSENKITFLEDLIGIEDLFFHLETVVCAKVITIIDKYLYSYRVSQKNSVFDKFTSTERIFQSFLFFDNVDKLFAKENLFDGCKYAILQLECDLFLYWFLRCSWKYKKRYYYKIREYFKKLDLSKYDLFMLSKNAFFIIFSDFLALNYIVFFVKYSAIKKWAVWSHTSNDIESR